MVFIIMEYIIRYFKIVICANLHFLQIFQALTVFITIKMCMSRSSKQINMWKLMKISCFVLTAKEKNLSIIINSNTTYKKKKKEKENLE